MMKSVCPGCGHEQACGHADVTHCADMLRMAEAERDEWRRAAESKQRLFERVRMLSARHRRAMLRAQDERDRYRAKALQLVCSRIEHFGSCACERCAVRLSGGDASYGYCAAVIEEVDGA